MYLLPFPPVMGRCHAPYIARSDLEAPRPAGPHISPLTLNTHEDGTMRRLAGARHGLAVLTALAVLGLGCARPTDPGTTPEPEGPPIDTPKNAWSWIDFPNSTCDEGTPTGLGVNLTDSKNLVIFFNGGGACWDVNTCLRLNVSTHGPITQTQFDQIIARLPPGSLFDRTVAANPFKDWNHFFIPYCTGDLHIGDTDATYTDNGTAFTFRHRGRANAVAFLARIASTVPSPEQVLVTGSSAGGYGAALNYALVRSYFPNARVSLVDDSGPLFKNDAMNPALRAAWASAWKYDAVLNDIDPAVKNDFSAVHTALSRKFPNDRMALLSSLQDTTIRTYLQMSPTAFEAALRDLNTTVIAPLPHTRSFLTSGSGHTMLLNPGAQRTGGVTLLTWLNQMQSASDADWKSLQP